MLGFFAAGAGLAVAAGLAVRTLRLSGVPAVVAWWVLVPAQVVAATELLSLFGAVGKLGYAVAEAAFLVAAAAAWHLRRPHWERGLLPPEARALREAVARAWWTAVDAVRAAPLLSALGAVVLLGFGYELFVVAASPPNNWDSMHYHLARAAAWRAQGSLGYVPTHNGIENAYPQNAELLVLWTLVFLGRDLLAALPQLLAGLATAASIYVIARRLGHGGRTSAFAALLFPTLTVVALESMTTQNDLVEASFVTAGVALALGGSTAEAGLAGLALGLAAGTKLTFLYAIPVLAVVGVLLLPRRRLATVAVSAVAGFALLGMYAYVQNLVETGRPQGRAQQVSSLPPHVTFRGTVSTIARTAYGLVDLSGFHPPGVVTEHVSGAAKRFFRLTGIPPNPPESTTTGGFPFGYGVTSVPSEDWSDFGPLGFLLLVPLSLGCLVAWALGATDRSRGAFALALPLYVVALAFGTRWNLYVGRFLATPAALTLPLAPSVLRFRLLRPAVLLVAAAALALALAYDRAKPSGADGRAPVWSRERVDVQTIQRTDLRDVLEAVARRVPPHARLGIDLGPDDWEYPLWGARLGRRLVWLPQQPAAGLDWVVLGTRIDRRPAGRWCATRFPRSHWQLLARGRCRTGR